MVWSGLRGAVSLAMAIVVDIHPSISEQMGSRVMFHVGGIAALTFLVQSTTAAKVVEFLGVTKKSTVRKNMMKQFEKHMAEDSDKSLTKHLQKSDDCRFSGANVDIVRAMVPALRKDGSIGEPSPSEDERSEAETAQSAPEGDAESDSSALLRIYREVHLHVVQHHYWQAIEEGILPKSDKVTRILLHSANEALDNAASSLNDWQVISTKWQVNADEPGAVMNFLGNLVEQPPFCWWPELVRTFSPEFRKMRKIYVALCFQEAHAHARLELPNFFGTDTSLDASVQEQVAYESQQECLRAAEFLQLMPEEQVELGKSEMLSRKLLQVQMEEIVDLLSKGLLKQSEADFLENQVTTAMRKIVHTPKSKWLEAK